MWAWALITLALFDGIEWDTERGETGGEAFHAYTQKRPGIDEISPSEVCDAINQDQADVYPMTNDMRDQIKFALSMVPINFRDENYARSLMRPTNITLTSGTVIMMICLDDYV